MMEKFKVLEHTADIEFISYGTDENELLKNSAEALVQIMNRKAVGRKTEKSFEVVEKAYELSDLIAYSLDSIVSRLDILNSSGTGCEIRELGKNGKEFHCRLKISYIEELPSTKIKAVTLHDMELKKADGIYSMRVTLDI